MTHYFGIAPTQLARIWATRLDDSGEALAPFTEPGGSWPLRCCLRDSLPGEELAIISLTPFPEDWRGAYRETGPVVIHAAGGCAPRPGFPAEFASRAQVMRAFGSKPPREQTQVDDRHRVLGAGDDLRGAIDEALRDERVAFVHVHNPVAQCYSFTAIRGDDVRPHHMPSRG